MCHFIEPVTFARCALILALRNITLDGYLDTRIPYGAKFSRAVIFANFVNLDVIAKISSAKINLLYSSTATPIRHKFVDVTPISAQLHVTTLRRHVVRKDMALLKYFKRVDHNPGLPDPNGSLSLTM